MIQRKFVIASAGILIFYFYFGVLQEKVTKGQYVYETKTESGEKIFKNETYTYSLALVFVMCMTNYIFSKTLLLSKLPEEDKTPLKYHASVALTYLLGMVCSNMALQWVSYPTQVVAKSAKPIPVMLWGVWAGRRSYPRQKYVFVLLIVGGAVMFMYKDNKDLSKKGPGFGIGEILLVLSLTMDGLTGAIQERIRASTKPSSLQQMMRANFFSVLYVGVGLLVTGEGKAFCEFVMRHPAVIADITILAVCGALGQLFIYMMVTNYGPLPCSIVCTTRKLFTVLASVLIFGHVLQFRQWLGTVVVFVGLYLDAKYGKSPNNPANNNKEVQKEVQ